MIDLADSYAASRWRLTELVEALPHDPKHIEVACCPGWSVHDVVSHLVAVAEDAAGGRLSGPPTDEQAAEQVARRVEMPTGKVLEAWAERGPELEQLLKQVAVWPALMDVLSHEHDVRAAVARPGARDIPEIRVCARRLIKGLDREMRVTMDGEEFGPGEAALHLRTTAWEAFRFRLGRRSRKQLAGMAWTGDPAPVLERLTIFGPSSTDIDEVGDPTPHNSVWKSQLCMELPPPAMKLYKVDKTIQSCRSASCCGRQRRRAAAACGCERLLRRSRRRPTLIQPQPPTTPHPAPT